MADFFPPMTMTCQITSIARNEWSDYEQTSLTDQLCHFRQIDNLRRITRGEELDADAMAWFPAGANIQIGTIVFFDGLPYQVETLTKSRRLGESTIQFLKTNLKITKVIS